MRSVPVRLAFGLVAAAHVAVAVAVLLVWRIGPVVAVIDESRGVHEGDLLALPLLAMGAIWLARAGSLVAIPVTRRR